MVKHISTPEAYLHARRVNPTANACSIIAAHLLTGIPQSTVAEAFDAEGRVPGLPVPRHVTLSAYKRLNVNLRLIDLDEQDDLFFSKYPQRYRYRLHLTSRHPHRFPAVWRSAPPRLLAHSKDHAFAIINGVNHDWSVNKAMRILSLWEVSR